MGRIITFLLLIFLVSCTKSTPKVKPENVQYKIVQVDKDGTRTEIKVINVKLK